MLLATCPYCWTVSLLQNVHHDSCHKQVTEHTVTLHVCDFVQNFCYLPPLCFPVAAASLYNCNCISLQQRTQRAAQVGEHIGSAICLYDLFFWGLLCPRTARRRGRGVRGVGPLARDRERAAAARRLHQCLIKSTLDFLGCVPAGEGAQCAQSPALC